MGAILRATEKLGQAAYLILTLSFTVDVVLPMPRSNWIPE